jgi:cytochrome b
MAWFFFVVLVAIVALQLGTGRAGVRGGRSVERARNPRGFLLLIAFEIAMLVLLGAGLITGLAR